VKIVAGKSHRDPCVACESLWTLPLKIMPRLAMEG
jgi:hypothetical protein